MDRLLTRGSAGVGLPVDEFQGGRLAVVPCHDKHQAARRIRTQNQISVGLFALWSWSQVCLANESVFYLLSGETRWVPPGESVILSVCVSVCYCSK
jgi:hypothetical protein